MSHLLVTDAMCNHVLVLTKLWDTEHFSYRYGKGLHDSSWSLALPACYTLLSMVFLKLDSIFLWNSLYSQLKTEHSKIQSPFSRCRTVPSCRSESSAPTPGQDSPYWPGIKPLLLYVVLSIALAMNQPHKIGVPRLKTQPLNRPHHRPNSKSIYKYAIASSHIRSDFYLLTSP